MIRAVTVKIETDFGQALDKIMSDLKSTEKAVSIKTVNDNNGNSFLVVVIESVEPKKVLLG